MAAMHTLLTDNYMAAPMASFIHRVVARRTRIFTRYAYIRYIGVIYVYTCRIYAVFAKRIYAQIFRWMGVYIRLCCAFGPVLDELSIFWTPQRPQIGKCNSCVVNRCLRSISAGCPTNWRNCLPHRMLTRLGTLALSLSFDRPPK